MTKPTEAYVEGQREGLRYRPNTEPTRYRGRMTWGQARAIAATHARAESHPAKSQSLRDFSDGFAEILVARGLAKNRQAGAVSDKPRKTVFSYQVDMFVKAAEAENMTFTKWAEAILIAAAKKTLDR